MFAANTKQKLGSTAAAKSGKLVGKSWGKFFGKFGCKIW